MNIQEIKERLVKKAVRLSPGGFKPAYTETESWLGKVYLFREEEEENIERLSNYVVRACPDQTSKGITVVGNRIVKDLSAMASKRNDGSRKTKQR